MYSPPARDKRRLSIHRRIRKKVRGDAARPRLAVFRSLKHIYAQVIDDENGRTLAMASSRDKDAAGPYGGAARFKYQRGPDGRSYAVGGEVSIDVSPESSPGATARKMAVVIRAAQAPADPSAQDRSVANQARQVKQQAESELRAEKTGSADGGDKPSARSLLSLASEASDAYGRGADLLSGEGTTGRLAPAHDRVV